MSQNSHKINKINGLEKVVQSHTQKNNFTCMFNFRFCFIKTYCCRNKLSPSYTTTNSFLVTYKKLARQRKLKEVRARTAAIEREQGFTSP